MAASAAGCVGEQAAAAIAFGSGGASSDGLSDSCWDVTGVGGLGDASDPDAHECEVRVPLVVPGHDSEFVASLEP